jgi:thioredoxin reductase
MTEIEQQYDVVVIGGGAAGLSGAVALARSRRTVLVVDAGQPRNARAAGVHNYLGREDARPADLLADGRAEVASYGGSVVRGVVTAVQREDDGAFRVTLDGGGAVAARRLLVATGLVDELPDVPGLAERWGRDVLHCPYCHGWEVRDEPIGILATGPTAVHQALLFRQLSGDVVFFQHTGPELPADQAEQLAALGIPVVDGEVTRIEVVDDRLSGVRLASGELVPRAAVVVAPRFTARAGVLGALGLAAVDQEMGGSVVGSAVPADPTGATAVPGVWVAGNISDMSAQVVVSAAAGMRAGAMINADLVAEDARRAVAALAGAR